MVVAIPKESAVKSLQLQSQSSASHPEQEHYTFYGKFSKSSPKEIQYLLGSISILMLHSQLHYNYSMALLEKQFLPSLLHGQFRYYEQAGRPIGFVNWAWLTEDLEGKFRRGDYLLKHGDWVGGENLWFPELIAPFGHVKAILKDLQQNILPDAPMAKAIRARTGNPNPHIAIFRRR